MIEKWFLELENKFPDIKCGKFVVMPNHFHCIIINTGYDSKKYDMGASDFGKQILGEHDAGEHNAGEHNLGEHVGSPLRTVIQWFKTMTTNEYIRGVKTLGWEPFNGKLWERNYWERIIRDEKSFENIMKYIINNPKNWNSDKLK